MLRKRAFACKLFDLIFLKGKEGEIEGLRTLAEELVCFEYAQSSDNFIEDLKNKSHWLWSMLTENSIGVIANLLCNTRHELIERLKEGKIKLTTDLIGKMTLGRERVVSGSGGEKGSCTMKCSNVFRKHCDW